MEEQMEIRESYFVVRVAPGEYYLGDPCYAIKDKHWDELLRQTDYFNNPVGKIGDHYILAFPTKYGDGGYNDQCGNEYGVDAGLIGLVPKEYVEEFEAERSFVGDMKLVKFNYEIECYNSKDGMLAFGKYKIQTG